jgi:uroporphyrinogen-III synthase
MSIPPLAGYTVAVTADRRREEQVELLRRRGASVVEGATIRTEPLGDDEAFREAVAALIADPPEVAVLLTALGVRTVMGAAESMGVGDQVHAALAAADIYTRGPKATGAAITAGFDVTWKTAGERSTELVEVLAERAAAGTRIAVLRDGDARPLTADALRARGADVIDIPVYRWSMPDDVAPANRVLDAVIARAVDAVTFTSSPALKNLVAIAEEREQGAELLSALNDDVLAVCIGPVCAESAEAVGITEAVTPHRARLGAMVLALAAELGGRARQWSIGDLELTVQGALARIGDRDVLLTDRERAVLHTLVDAGGAVVPKELLLRRVWGDVDADAHAVEVTVGRLRRRLGEAGGAVQTVPRRGYRLACAGS